MELKISELLKEDFVIANLRFDLRPEDIFKPRFASEGNLHKLKAETQGFFFYVEIAEKGPVLMLMKNYDFSSKTIASIVDAPRQLLDGAVGAPGVKEMAGMYPIDSPLEAWIKGQLGL